MFMLFMFIGIDQCIVQGRKILIISDQKHCLINIFNHYKFAVKMKILVLVSISIFCYTLYFLSTRFGHLLDNLSYELL